MEYVSIMQHDGFLRNVRPTIINKISQACHPSVMLLNNACYAIDDAFLSMIDCRTSLINALKRYVHS